jgi:AraC-like DNA-binding protein
MPSSAVRRFQDPWEHQAFFRGADMKVLVTGTGQYRSALTRIDLHRLWMQRNATSLPQIAHIVANRDRSPIGFLVDTEQPAVLRHGTEFLPGTIVFSTPGADGHVRSTGPSRWGTMSLTPDDLASAGRALAGRELTPPTVSQVIRPPQPLMARLTQLHAAACHLAATAPGILATDEVAKAMEQELVRTMIRCLTEGTEVGKDAPGRVPVMQRFERALREMPGRPIYVGEICGAIGVAERTLRMHCLEHLGISPHRYLWLRRMHQVRRALAVADAKAFSVTAIATDHGFWELGRFSVAYRTLFGESPSVTLRSPADRPLAAANAGAPMARLPVLP